MRAFIFAATAVVVATIGAPLAAAASRADFSSMPPPLILADLSPMFANPTDTKWTPFYPDRSVWKSAASTLLNTFFASYPAVTASAQFNASGPILIDTQGSLINAVTQIQTLFQAGQPYSVKAPPFVVIADGATATSQAVLTLNQLLQSYDTPIFVTSSNLVDAATTMSNVYRIAPTDATVATAMIDILYSAGWYGMGMVSTDDVGGASCASAVVAELASRGRGFSEILRKVTVPAGRTRDSTAMRAADEAALLQIAYANARGVLVCGESDAAPRMLSALYRLQQRAIADEASVRNVSALLPGMFIALAPSTETRFPMIPTAGVTFYSGFTNSANKPATKWPTSLLNSTMSASVGDSFRWLVGPILDAVLLYVAAAAATPVSNVLATVQQRLTSVSVGSDSTFSTLTEAMQLDAATRARAPSSSRVQFVQQSRTLASTATVLATWGGVTGSVSTVPDLLSAVVHPMPLESITVCLLSADSCFDQANMLHAYFTLLANAESVMPSGVTVVPKPMSMGVQGIKGMPLLLASAATCDVAIGPGRSTIVSNVYPILNYYGIAMVDYASTSPAFSDKTVYPLYSRIIPTETYIAAAVAATFSTYAWNRIAIITTRDSYGGIVRDAYTSAFAAKSIYVENTVQLDPDTLNNATLYTTLKKIRDTYITRIVVVALSTSDENLESFYRNVRELNMTTTHIFYLSDTVCQYGTMNPTLRAGLLCSFCVTPMYDEAAFNQAYLAMLGSGSGMARAQQALVDGSFTSTGCDMSASSSYSPFATDAALTVLDSLSRMTTANGGVTFDATTRASIFANGSSVAESIRATRIQATTGVVSFDTNGDRTNAAYNINIMQAKGAVVVATWNSGTGYSKANLATPIVWLDNTTNVPLTSLRSNSFIVITTITRNPATIVISVIGFAATIAAFVFCYRYYDMQRKIEAANASSVEGAKAQQPGGPDALAAPQKRLPPGVLSPSEMGAISRNQ